MRIPNSRAAARRHCRNARRGSALVLVLVLAMGLAALAMSAIYLSSHAQLVTRSFEREADYSFAADAGVAMGRSRLDADAWALPDTGWITLHDNVTIQDADDVDIPGVRVNVWVGPTGSVAANGQRFGSIVAEALDGNGSRFIRHLEVTRESFAKFAYFSNLENRADGSVILFGGGDVLNGPVWSNDTLQIHSTGAEFNDSVGTAGVIIGESYGSFAVPPLVRQRRIELPSTAALANLRGHATVSGFAFTGLLGGTDSAAVRRIRHRIEFVNVDLNADGDSTDADEGFFKFYDTHDTLSGTMNSRPLNLTLTQRGTYYTSSGWLRGDSVGVATGDPRNVDNCGDWHRDNATGRMLFFPASVHDTTGWSTDPVNFRHRWFYDWLIRNETEQGTGTAERRFGGGADADELTRVMAHMGAARIDSILGAAPTRYRPSGLGSPTTAFPGGIAYPPSRCFLGGDPHLVAVERNYVEGVNRFAPAPYTASVGWPYATIPGVIPVGTATDWQKGGDDSTFTPTGSRGAWRRWTGAVDARLAARRPWDADHLFPISRLINTASRGVIYADASIGVSGTLRGRVTVHSAGNIVILDDLVYATDPSSPTRACADVLGMISDTNVEIASNGILMPRNLRAYNGGTNWRSLGSPVGGSVGISIHAVIMSRATSVAVENYAYRPNATDASTTGGVLACNGSAVGRGCLRLWGGLIQERRGPVGRTDGVGYIKQYGYDVCGASNPPPYFPTTGRYAENRYTEVDPVGFDAGAFFRARTPDREP